jgi:simple sugar transport system substrate-binding protein
MKHRSLRLLTVLGVVALFAAACQAATPSGSGGAAAAAGGGPDGALVKRSDIKIEIVTHGQAQDGFWGVVRNGVKAGAAQMGVTANYSAPGAESDMPGMVSLIDAAVAKKPTGLVVSIPNADALGPAIQKAVAAGIPVISANSGSDAYKELGVMTHVGQDEEIAGEKAGELMKAAGVTNALCINQEVGNAGLDARCKGFTTGLGGTVKVVQVDLKDPTAAQQSIAAAVQGNAGVNGILALGPTGATPTIKAMEQLNNTDIKVATFDLSKDVLDAIKADKMLFAIDQQQYLQGYLPIVFLTLNKLYGLQPGGGQPVLTGPGIVDKTNVDTVLANTGTTR